MYQNQLKLPYEIIDMTEIANRESNRENFMRGVETWFIPFENLQIREGFNPRVEYNGIEELADKITVNGLTALTVDAKKDGKAIVEKGHRRYKALRILWEKGILQNLELPGIKRGQVLCFINSKEVSELDRIKNAIADNDSEPLTPVEQADCIWRMKHLFNMSTDEIIATTGLSRQHIDNRLILADQSPLVKKAIQDGFATPTVVTQLARVVETPERVEEVVSGMVKQEKKLRGADVEEIRRHEEKTEEEPDTAYDENRDEIKWCQNVIRNVDKLNSIVSKVDNEQMKKDVDELVGWIQKDMAEIREYVKTHKRK